jgi:hypothetical protein
MSHAFTSYPYLEARSVADKPGVGMGLFAKKAFRAGEVVLRLEFWDEKTSELIPWEDTEDEHQDRCTAVAPGWYWFVTDRHPFWFLNHGCRPTVAYADWAAPVDDAVPLVAVRDIAAGEEITIDYSSMTTADDGLEEGEPWRMTCLCGAPDCRGVLTEFVGMPEARALELAVAGQVPAFILAESDALTLKLKEQDPVAFQRFTDVLETQRELVDEFWDEYEE